MGLVRSLTGMQPQSLPHGPTRIGQPAAPRIPRAPWLPSLTAHCQANDTDITRSSSVSAAEPARQRRHGPCLARPRPETRLRGRPQGTRPPAAVDRELYVPCSWTSHFATRRCEPRWRTVAPDTSSRWPARTKSPPTLGIPHRPSFAGNHVTDAPPPSVPSETSRQAEAFATDEAAARVERMEAVGGRR